LTHIDSFSSFDFIRVIPSAAKGSFDLFLGSFVSVLQSAFGVKCNVILSDPSAKWWTESEESLDLTKVATFIEEILRRFAPQNDSGSLFHRLG